MILISKPKIIEFEKQSDLVCYIKADYLGEKEIHFSVLKPFDTGLTEEVSDAFLLASLLPALRHGEDIEVEGNVSERLYFNIIHSLIYLLSKSYGYAPVKVSVGGVVKTSFDGKAVGCGCSLGIDSLSAIFTHLHTPETPDFQITHLTFFNVGSHGYKNAEANRQSYLRDMVEVDRFAAKLGLPVVKIESNVWVLFDGFNFDQSGNLINMSTVLAMQKLFGKYLYGSNYPMSEVKLTNQCSGYFETIMLPLASTESTELIVANADMSRSDKTAIVARHEMSKEHLYVCWKELIINNDPSSPIAKVRDKVRNCTRCSKCLRTCAQLEILGVLDDYGKIFDLPYYYKVKNQFLGRAIAFRRGNAFFLDIVNMAARYDKRMPKCAKLYALAYRLKVMAVVERLKYAFAEFKS